MTEVIIPNMRLIHKHELNDWNSKRECLYTLWFYSSCDTFRKWLHAIRIVSNDDFPKGGALSGFDLMTPDSYFTILVKFPLTIF